MIQGSVNARLEAIIAVSIRTPGSGTLQVNAVVDTGFTGWLSLPAAVAATLSLAPAGFRRVTLGDRSDRLIAAYSAEVDWDTGPVIVPVLELDGDPLVGCALLKGCHCEIDFVDGGLVKIVSALP